VVSPKTGNLKLAIMVTQVFDSGNNHQQDGTSDKLPLKNIPELGRATQGVILMRFADKGDNVAAAAVLEKGGEMRRKVKKIYSKSPPPRSIKVVVTTT